MGFTFSLLHRFNICYIYYSIVFSDSIYTFNNSEFSQPVLYLHPSHTEYR